MEEIPKEPAGMYIEDPVNNGIFTISTGAGCLPSIVSQQPGVF